LAFALRVAFCLRQAALPRGLVLPCGRRRCRAGFFWPAGGGAAARNP